MNGLAALLDRSAQCFPDRVALSVPDGPHLTYRETAVLSGRLRDYLYAQGIRRGDRVGLRLHKSIDAVISIFGILKAGAAYVPVDADSPASRGAFILNDCGVKAVVTERKLEAALRVELDKVGASPLVIALAQDTDPVAIRGFLTSVGSQSPVPEPESAPFEQNDIAYLLYTSGSTGKPKGVVLSHGNAASFLAWCSETFQPRADDTFSSHAPFHFDLSILDIFVPIQHGARLVLLSENLGKDPIRLAATIATEKITSWYSTPSILSLLAQYGRLQRYDYSALRMVLFAGEVFPVPRFSALHAFWPKARFFNLYGPTETNVCTYYEVPPDDSWNRMDTFPIGRMCAPNAGRVVDEHGIDVEPGIAGELVVSGPNVMCGYWNLPDQNHTAFLDDKEGRRWYRTGDVVSQAPDGNYLYLGRRDRMVKRRGYRVELDEIETALRRQSDIREAAVVATPHPDGVRLTAFVCGQSDRAPSIMGLKRVSSECLPPYMIPDVFVVLESLPRTSTDKIDYQTLRSLT